MSDRLDGVVVTDLLGRPIDQWERLREWLLDRCEEHDPVTGQRRTLVLMAEIVALTARFPR